MRTYVCLIASSRYRNDRYESKKLRLVSAQIGEEAAAATFGNRLRRGPALGFDMLGPADGLPEVIELHLVVVALLDDAGHLSARESLALHLRHFILPHQQLA